jgi:hypothetical protein
VRGIHGRARLGGRRPPPVPRRVVRFRLPRASPSPLLAIIIDLLMPIKYFSSPPEEANFYYYF